MLKQPITFEDFNGVTRTADVYFNLTKAELVDWSANSEHGIQKDMQDAVDEKDMRKLLDFIKELIFRSYGVKDKDGVHFDKSPEISKRFENSAMYSPLLLALFADEGETVQKFINGLMPADLVAQAAKEANIPFGEHEAIREQYAPSARDIAAQQANVISEPRIESFHNPQDAAPIDAHPFPAPISDEEPAQATRQAFRVKETPMDADIAEERRQRQAQADAEAAEFAEFKRRREAGEL